MTEADAAGRTDAGAEIDAVLVEARRYPPDPGFAATATAASELFDLTMEQFWEREGRERVRWIEPFTQLYSWQSPVARWYLGGRLNACDTCVDRHVEAGLGDKIAVYWEGEPVGDRRAISFAQLQHEVVQCAAGLRRLGVTKGTPVGIYMGMIPELPVAMLACARLGAPFTVVFGGFSADALGDRLRDMGCEVLITQDAAWRRGRRVELKRTADEALAQAPSVRAVVVAERAGGVSLTPARDVTWSQLVDGMPTDPASCPCESMDAEDPLYLLYSSGTTGKPKGIVHTTGGYLVGVASTHRAIFDIKPDTIYWCAADIGWVTGHSYIVFGPLANATTSVLYEGSPDFPDKDRWWEIVERYRVEVLYAAPTAIRTHMKWGEAYAQRHDLSSIRLLGSVGEPINPEAWIWYRKHIGADRAPVVDTWWQTETGMIMIAPLPGVHTLKPGSASKPFPGVRAAVVDARGKEVPAGQGGLLVLQPPWPAMARGLHNDPERFASTYWDRFPGLYLTGDGARCDEDGDYWLLGRVDDVMNVSGHRLSTIELESTLVEHPRVCEAAVIGRSDARTGQAVVAFVTLVGDRLDAPEEERAVLEELRAHVGRRIGKFATPALIVLTPELPKTRSGKIMRRLLRDVAEQRHLGDTTTLADPDVVADIGRLAQARAGDDEA